MMRFFRRLALVCLGLVGALVLAGVLGTLIPHPGVFSAPAEAVPTRHILLVSNTIHTDIALPINAETMSALDFMFDTGLPVTHPDARYLLVGWGGRSFYLETPTLADIRPGPAFRALTVDSSVMHVDVVGQIATSDPAVMELAVSEAAYTHLLNSVSESFARKQGLVLPIEGFAFGTADRFFEAEGSFNALMGCNVWTSRMLRSAGIRTGLWNPIPPSLTASVRMFNGPDDGAAKTP